MKLFDSLLNRMGYYKDARTSEIMAPNRMLSSVYGAPVPENYAKFMKA